MISSASTRASASVDMLRSLACPAGDSAGATVVPLVGGGRRVRWCAVLCSGHPGRSFQNGRTAPPGTPLSQEPARTWFWNGPEGVSAHQLAVSVADSVACSETGHPRGESAG
jgi:hypothetical protein